MEGVAAAASVAGILILVGQTTGGLEKLKDFYGRLATASRTVDKFLQDIDWRLRALTGVEDIFARWPVGKTDVHIMSLRVQVEQCFKNVFNWLDTARDMRRLPTRAVKLGSRGFGLLRMKGRS